MADIQLEQHVSLVEAATLAHDRLNMCLSTIKDVTSRSDTTPHVPVRKRRHTHSSWHSLPVF
eukprot:12779-Eustigmatos_ZCMA.PRE.1